MSWYKITWRVKEGTRLSHTITGGAFEMYASTEEELQQKAIRQAARQAFGSAAYCADIVITATLMIERPRSHRTLDE